MKLNELESLSPSSYGGGGGRRDERTTSWRALSFCMAALNSSKLTLPSPLASISSNTSSSFPGSVMSPGRHSSGSACMRHQTPSQHNNSCTCDRPSSSPSRGGNISYMKEKDGRGFLLAASTPARPCLCTRSGRRRTSATPFVIQYVITKEDSIRTSRERDGRKALRFHGTWKQSRSASSPRELRRLDSPHRISLMSTVPSRLLSNRSNTRGASGTSASSLIALSTCSNSASVAFSPSAHLQPPAAVVIHDHPMLSCISLLRGNIYTSISYSHPCKVSPQVVELLGAQVMPSQQVPQPLRPQRHLAAEHAGDRRRPQLPSGVEPLQLRHDLRVHEVLLRAVPYHPRMPQQLVQMTQKTTKSTDSVSAAVCDIDWPVYGNVGGRRDIRHLLLASCKAQQREDWRSVLWLMKRLSSMYGPGN
uniref:Uncharacterized protein n=1 Tax=Zea mays TaxID=4577 RepID=A0A804P0Q1_MAIZE